MIQRFTAHVLGPILAALISWATFLVVVFAAVCTLWFVGSVLELMISHS